MFIPTSPRFLFAPDKGDGDGTPSDPPAGDPPPPPPDPAGDKTADGTFTQAEVDALIAKRLGRERANTEKFLKDAAERESLDESDRLKAEKADAEKAADEARREVLAERVSLAAERAALAAKVNPERVDRFLRMVDLSDLDSLTADGKVDADAIAKAVAATLEDVPEFGAGAPKPPGGGDFSGSGGAPKQWTRADIAKLTPAEFDKHEAEIMEQMRSNAVK